MSQRQPGALLLVECPGLARQENHGRHSLLGERGSVLKRLLDYVEVLPPVATFAPVGDEQRRRGEERNRSCSLGIGEDIKDRPEAEGGSREVVVGVLLGKVELVVQCADLLCDLADVGVGGPPPGTGVDRHVTGDTQAQAACLQEALLPYCLDDVGELVELASDGVTEQVAG